ncbi:MAG TPA: hypothetical protein VNE41_02675, partial [Chitinophagaceae bacterium]|nr:hypothetical protein [Chitinophagaceae bacterium]
MLPQKTDRETPFFITVIYLLLTTGLFVFVILHAFRMDITHDEAFSFYLEKINYFKAMTGTANTHWLNSFFMKIFNLIFGDKPGWLRLQSILAFPFFALGFYTLSSPIKNQLLRLSLYCLVLFNPYLLDFFSLARGYGMALAFQVWMVVFLVKAIVAIKFIYKTWLTIFLLAALSIASNLSFLYSVLGVL